MKHIVAREAYCIGCRLCEVNCLIRHSKVKNIIKAFKHERDRSVPGVIVEDRGVVSFAVQCRHCDEARCIEACISGAMHRDPNTQAVMCDENRCVGCWSCIMACPVGAVMRGKGKKVASKCDLCAGEPEPACVAGCPNEALTLEER